jgi:pilus assembly protein CpaB
MNSTLLRALALIMVIGAISTAWIGYRISTKPPASEVKLVAPTYTQIVAAQDIPQGQMLTIQDIETATLDKPVPRGYKHEQDVLGKVAVQAIAKGTPLTVQHLPAFGALAQSITPDQRAVAIKVNEVIGVGGFVKPGDYVDVLLYLRADRETDNISSAQVVLSNVKVLAYGERVNEPEPLSAPGEEQAAEPVNFKLEQRADSRKEKDGRSAILAVPESLVSKLMLAESSGVLRLALRGAMLSGNEMGQAENHFIRLDQVAKSTTERLASAQQEPKAPIKQSSSAALGKSERVIVHRAERVDVVTVAR